VRLAWVAAGLAVTLVPCGEAPVPAASPSLLEGPPLPPGAVRLEFSGERDAAEAVYRSGQPGDSVAAWYRRWFLENEWRIAGDGRLPDKSVVLRAERDGRPVT
jgi:hypothetical protein